MMSVAESWVMAASRRGDLPTVMVGRYRRFRREAVEDWIAKQEN